MKNSKLSIYSKTTFVYLFMIKGLISTDVCSGPLRAERRRREARREKCTFNKCTLPTIPLGRAGRRTALGLVNKKPASNIKEEFSNGNCLNVHI